MRYKAFISYRRNSSVNAYFVLNSIIDNSGYSKDDIFLDEQNIGPEHFDTKIKSAIENSNCIVLLVTKKCFKPKKGEEEYLYDDKALERYRKTHKGSFILQRYKGLGEMDPEQLWETTLDPATRILKRVEIEDGRMASDVTEMLMGTEVPPRKAFIYEHAQDAELDI